jgi:hypothetical protein
VLILREARQNEGAWPTAIPGIGTSICKNEKWNYAVNPDDSATLTFSGKIDCSSLLGVNIPMQWTEPALVGDAQKGTFLHAR